MKPKLTLPFLLLLGASCAGPRAHEHAPAAPAACAPPVAALAPATPTAPAAPVAAAPASGRPEIRYYEINAA